MKKFIKKHILSLFVSLFVLAYCVIHHDYASLFIYWTVYCITYRFFSYFDKN